MTKYIQTSAMLGSVFTTREMEQTDEQYHPGYAWMLFEETMIESLVLKAGLDDDVKCGAVAIWNGQEYMKMKYGRWVIHRPLDETI